MTAPDDTKDGERADEATDEERATDGEKRAEQSETNATHSVIDELVEGTPKTAGESVDSVFLEPTELTAGQSAGLPTDQATTQERRATYGYVRAFFLARTDDYYGFQRTLNRARIGTSYDKYLTRLAYLTALAAVAGIVVGIVVGWVLTQFGVFAGVTLPSAPAFIPAELVTAFNESRTALGIGLIAVLVGGAIAATTWIAGKVYPRYVVSNRKHSINLVLPDAIVFMYALSESGMNLGEIITRLADADDAYGEVAAEFDVARRDMQLYGNDLYTSLQNLRNLTPSENLAGFLDDLLSLQEAGGDVTSFLDDQSERQSQRANENQEDLLNNLSVLSEVFVVGFVAAPLFIVVIMIVISLLGDEMLFELGLFIYAAMPLAFLGFGVLISSLLDPYVQSRMALRVDDAPTPYASRSNPTKMEESEEYTRFQRFYRRKRLLNRLSSPLAFLQANPLWSLALTVPLSLVYLVVLAWQGAIPLSASGWQVSPISATNRGVVLPLLITLTPVAILYEFGTRRRRDVIDRFPNTLNVLSSSNSMGISLVDALGVVAQTSSGYYARQLRLLQRDIRWNNDPSAALLRFANRLDVPVISRTLKLLAEGRRSTTDLSKVLRIAARDTRNRFRLARKQKQEMTSYIAVVIVGYLVFLGVIVILDQSYLATISEIAETTEETDRQSGLPLGDIPVDTYRLLFFHAVIIQAIGTGLISGLLTDNRVISGFKYTVALLVLASAVFTLT